MPGIPNDYGSCPLPRVYDLLPGPQPRHFNQTGPTQERRLSIPDGRYRATLTAVRQGAVALAIAVAHWLPATTSHAQQPAYPDRPIRLIVPFAAGSATDVVARQIAPRMAENLGQSIVVDNRAGASGVIGATAVAKAPADGYTLLFGTAPTNAIAQSWDKNLPYDAVKDFVAVAGLTTAPYVLAVTSTLPVRSVKELIAYAKSRPGELNFASTGNGTGVHLAGTFFGSKAGVDIKHVPYNGAGPMNVDLASGVVHMIFYPYQGLLPLIQAGKVHVLATTGAKRLPLLPDVPTLQEQGLADFSLASWQGIYAPAGTPADRVNLLYEAIRKTMTDPKVTASIAQTGNAIELSDPAEFAAFTRREIEKYRQIIQGSEALKAAR